MGTGWMIAAGVAAVVIVDIAVMLVWRKRRKSRPAANADVFRSLLNVPGPAATGVAGAAGAAGSNDPALEKLRQNLRVKLLYQEDKVDQAIAFERERNPGGSHADLMRAAIERWERDNR